MRESANPQIHERPHGERAIVLGVEVLDRVVGIILKPDRSPRCRIRSGLQNCRACVPDSVEVNFELHNRQYTACYLAIDNLPSGILQFLEIDVTTWRFPPPAQESSYVPGQASHAAELARMLASTLRPHIPEIVRAGYRVIAPEFFHPPDASAPFTAASSSAANASR